MSGRIVGTVYHVLHFLQDLHLPFFPLVFFSYLLLLCLNKLHLLDIVFLSAVVQVVHYTCTHTHTHTRTHTHVHAHALMSALKLSEGVYVFLFQLLLV